MNFILDLILAAVLVLFFIRGWRKGFVVELIDLVGVIAAALLAMGLGELVTNWVYATFMREPLAQRIAAAVTSTVPTMEEIHAMLEGFPAFIVRALEHYGITEQSLYASASGAEGSLTVALADAVSPVILTVLKFFVVILLFFILLMALRAVSRMLSVAFRIPLIRQVNEILGAVLSLLKGVIVVWLVCAALNIAVPMLRPAARDKVEDCIHASIIFDVVYEHNPVYSLLL